MSQQHIPSESDVLQQAALDHMWMPTQAFSKIAEDGVRIITEGQGTKLKDIDGVWRYDGSAGLMLVNVGHGRQEIVDAISAQLSRLHYADTFSYATPDVIRFGAKLASLTPGDLNRVLFVSGGSEAVESALKIAYQYHVNRGEPGRVKFIARQGSYHGVSRGALSVGTANVLVHETWAPILPDTSRFAPQPLLYRDDESATQEENDIRCAQAIEDIIVAEGADTVAAVIAEPISLSAGVAIPGDRYWPMLREICDRHGVLLIADEVITGFGRTGKWFAMEHWGVTPDLMTLAKGITSGYWPTGACIVTDKVFDAFKGGPETTYTHGFTYGGHPAAGAAGLANVAIMEREDLPGNAARMGKRMLDRLQSLRKHALVGDVRGIGLLCAVELVKDKTTKEPFNSIEGAAKLLKDRITERGMLTRAGNIILLVPPLTVTEHEVDEMVDIVDEAITFVEEQLGLG
jgi:adenosylmethionine-8-amino-7-oxononanoate aminotransferase